MVFKKKFCKLRCEIRPLPFLLLWLLFLNTAAENMETTTYDYQAHPYE